jgi:hypothetical protein
VAAVSAVVLLFGRNLNMHDLAWLLFGYLGLYGLNLFTLAGRMLFAEREMPVLVHA